MFSRLFPPFRLPVQQPDDFLHVPNVIGKPSLHRGRDPKRLMHPAKVVVHHVQVDRRLVVQELLGKGVGQASEAAYLHPQYAANNEAGVIMLNFDEVDPDPAKRK